MKPMTLAELQARAELLDDRDKAMREIIFSTLRLLHERGTLPLPALISALQSSKAFGQAAFDEPGPKTLPMLIESLQAISAALDAAGSASSG